VFRSCIIFLRLLCKESVGQYAELKTSQCYSWKDTKVEGSKKGSESCSELNWTVPRHRSCCCYWPLVAVQADSGHSKCFAWNQGTVGGTICQDTGRLVLAAPSTDEAWHHESSLTASSTIINAFVRKASAGQLAVCHMMKVGSLAILYRLPQNCTEKEWVNKCAMKAALTKSSTEDPGTLHRPPYDTVCLFRLL
jgi:hypothetical protein